MTLCFVRTIVDIVSTEIASLFLWSRKEKEKEKEKERERERERERTNIILFALWQNH